MDGNFGSHTDVLRLIAGSGAGRRRWWLSTEQSVAAGASTFVGFSPVGKGIDCSATSGGTHSEINVDRLARRGDHVLNRRLGHRTTTERREQVRPWLIPLP
jgi:hypothetical protein